MPKVTKQTIKKSFRSKTNKNTGVSTGVYGERQPIPDVVNVDLPRKIHEPPKNLNAFSFMLYGVLGIGKSTLANMFGNAFFMMFERDLTLKTKQKLVKYWTEACAYIDLLLEGNHDFDTVVLDNMANAYDMSMDYAGQKHDFDHPGGMDDYGQSWNKVKMMFRDPLLRLLNSDFGVIFLAHEKIETIKTASGYGETMRIRPDCSGQAYQFLGATVENLFYYHYWQKERWLQIVGDELVDAKVKFDDNFFTKGGERIHRIPMGKNAKQSYQNLLDAFDNKQTETYELTKSDKIERNSMIKSKNTKSFKKRSK